MTDLAATYADVLAAFTNQPTGVTAHLWETQIGETVIRVPVVTDEHPDPQQPAAWLILSDPHGCLPADRDALEQWVIGLYFDLTDESYDDLYLNAPADGAALADLVARARLDVAVAEHTAQGQPAN